MGKQISELTDEELEAEYKKWDEYISNATGWGAALTAADEFRTACAKEMLHRKVNRPVKVPTDPLKKVAFTPTHRHFKNGKYYETVGLARMCVSRVGFSDFPANGTVMGDGDFVVVYRDGDGNLFVRRTEEFQDGRFAES